MAIARDEGDEDDYAHTLESYDWRSRGEVADLLARARTWQRPTAIIWALNVAGRDLVYRHGDLQAAISSLHDLRERSRRYGTLPSEAEALVQLALALAILGEEAQSREALGQARELVARLGTEHRLRFAITAVGSVRAYFYGGDWPALAASAEAVAVAPLGKQSPIGLTAASFALLNNLRAGHLARAQAFMAEMPLLFEQTTRTTYVFGGSLDRAATAVWELGAAEFAAQYRRLAEELFAGQLGDGPLKSFELIAARMAALQGDLPAATAYFTCAREVLEAAGHRPMRAIVDYDEALALVRTNSTDRARIAALLDAAITQFVALGMGGWEQRARLLREEQESRGTGEQVIHAPTPPRPHALTPREAEVLRLVAGGNTNREIAETLFLSVPTVQRHIANIYNKIGARGRADATAYALRHGILPESVD
ncbi:MAG: response regulator transcription factor [Thermomicrobiales bacterium]